MIPLPLALISASFAILNRARGTKFFNVFGSTTEGRILSMWLMGVITGIAALGFGHSDIESLSIGLWTMGSLYFWCVFGWDKYWSAAIGHPTDLTTKAFAPVDWIMSLLPTPKINFALRLWGLLAMTMRQSLAAIFLLGLAFLSGHLERASLAGGVLLLGLPYYIAGYFRINQIAAAEYVIGALLGLFTFLIVA